MFLFARLVSLAIFALVLMLICIFISNTNDKKRAAGYLTIYTVILTVMGYLFVPHSGADLTRLWIVMHQYAREDVMVFLQSLTSSLSPGVVLYYNIIGRLGNDHLLPAVSALITFSFCFAILHSLLKKESTGFSTTEIAIALFLFMSRGLMMQIISNIRTLMALSIAAWCIYQEFYNKRSTKKLIIPYLLAASLHAMGIIIVLYRIAYSFIDQRGTRLQKINRWVLGFSAAAAVLLFGWKYILRVINKGFNYIRETQSGEGYFYLWEFILCVMTLMVLLYVIHFFRRAYRYNRNSGSADDLSHATNQLLRYLTPLIIIEFIAIPLEFSTFQRINWYFTILLLPLTVCTLREVKLVSPAHAKVFRYNLLIAATAILFLACARGDLCSLKFFGG